MSQTAKCAWCGKEFPATRIVSSFGATYCSEKCKTERNRELGRGKQ